MNLDRLKKSAPWALAIVIALATPTVWAQSVDIGGTTLTLGASRAQTLGVASAEFNVAPAHANGQYFLYPKVRPMNDGKTVAPHAVGSINIQNGELVRVTRNLGSFRSADGQAAIQNMIEAFAQAPSQGRRPAVHTDTNMTGDASTTRVYFSYPDRVIQVSVYQPADMSVAATVDITEQYALPTAGQPTTAQPDQ
ncbi:MAG: hypothetical protein PF501_09480 [Salinisphaera sp.]|jgi:hypothetical protein|nr:hypothetical protein [Salinisphaera sp.]